MPYRQLSRVVLLLAMLIGGCSAASPQSLPVDATLVPVSELPDFKDDLDLDGLYQAIQYQLAVLRREGDRSGFMIGKVRYRTEQLFDSLERFSRLLAITKYCLEAEETQVDCYDSLRQQIGEQFLVYRLDSALLTGYYTPTVEVSTQRTEKYRYPIYRPPARASERGLSRESIDFEHELDGKGYELYYAADLFDIYVMHIEGGAKVKVHDRGRTYTKYLLYAADNGLEFSQLSEYMLRQRMLGYDKSSRWDQRLYLKKHPQKVRRIFSSCPGYVFFKVSNTQPITSTGIPLTANRSLATDPEYYPVKGAIAYVVAKMPQPPSPSTPPESNPRKVKYRTMQRFFIDQDIGHFITGQARADLFFGEGPYAEFLANNFMTRGSIYLLISK